MVTAEQLGVPAQLLVSPAVAPPTSNDCQGGTISGPVQPLGSPAVAPPTSNDCQRGTISLGIQPMACGMVVLRLRVG